MDMYESLFSSGSVLNEQVARQIFDMFPEKGPVVVIIDKDNHCWPSDTEEFAKLNISETFLEALCAKVDDGVEPVITQTDNCSVVAGQLTTERTNCGYVMIALPNSGPESSLVNIDLIEIVLNQVNLIAKLIEKNNLLYELQLKNYNAYSQGNMILN